jgi:hypothetical protein
MVNASRPRTWTSQIQLLHVISTDGDTATTTGLLTWRRVDLQRQYGEKRLTLAEADLDTTTIGNFAAFRTARLQRTTAAQKTWEISRCDGSQRCGLTNAQWEKHLGTVPNEPLSFVSTDSSFIKDHNDIFNCNVITPRSGSGAIWIVASS